MPSDDANERWLPVVGYETHYAISDKGQLKRVAGGQGATAGRMVSIHTMPCGYRRTELNRGGVRKSKLVHCLVAEAFIGPCPAGKEVNHKDGVKANNTPENLEYLTRPENLRHAERMGLMNRAAGERHGNAKMSDAQVVEARNRYAAGGTTMQRLADEFNVTKTCIWTIVRRKYRKSA